nr:MAG TPA: hypothetical protein [Microviridae sp.]
MFTIGSNSVKLRLKFLYIKHLLSDLMITQSQYLVKFSAKKMFIFSFLNSTTVDQPLESVVLQVMKHLLNAIITNVFHPVRMRFIKLIIVITRRTHLPAVNDNEIISITLFTMLFKPFSAYARTIGCKHELRRTAIIVSSSITTSLFLHYVARDVSSSVETKLANKVHTVFPDFRKTSRSISVITICAEPKNFVAEINIKQYVMIMGTTMKFTIFTTAEEANTTAILTTKIFHECLMKSFAKTPIGGQMVVVESTRNEISRGRSTGFVNSSDSPLTGVFKPAANALLARTADETAIVSKFRVRGKTAVKTIMLFSVFRERSYDRVHENRIITYHINHLYRLYQD